MKEFEYYSYKIRKEKADKKLNDYLKKVICVLKNKAKGLSLSDIGKVCDIAHHQTVLRIYQANIEDHKLTSKSRKL
jgi:hypothetical protein